MDRKQFTFYASFYNSISRIKNKAARCDAYDAICSYALTGEHPDLDKLPDAAAIAFLGSKANIDASRRKAEAGKSGGMAKKTESKPEAKGKQTGSNGNEQTPEKQEQVKEQEQDKDKDKDKEQVQEQMLEPPTPLTPTDKAAAVLADYLDRVNPSASPSSLDELRGYVDAMGPEVCRRAIDIALDSKKATWPYIRAILRDKQTKGVRCLADWEALETSRKEERESKKSGSMVGKDFQPSAERIQKNADWLDGFLAEQGVEP